jgi:hypothetical protein
MRTFRRGARTPGLGFLSCLFFEALLLLVLQLLLLFSLLRSLCFLGTSLLLFLLLSLLYGSVYLPPGLKREYFVYLYSTQWAGRFRRPKEVRA